MTGDCGDCGHSVSYWVKVGDCAYGNDVEDWDCEVSEEMTDEDVELSNEGKCPHWIPLRVEE